MSKIYDLSERELYQLKSIDPNLSSNWKNTLSKILVKVDKESQEAIFHKILSPLGVYQNRDSQLSYHKPKSLEDILKENDIKDPSLRKIIEHMKDIITQVDRVEVSDFANNLEMVLSNYDKFDLDENPRLKRQIRDAFIYDVAEWSKSVKFNIEAGIRNLDQKIIKSYLREVYLKQQLQGLDFRSWDAFDIQSIDGIPEWIKVEAKTRQYYVVETVDYWFIVGQADKPGNNPYSFRQFLYEDGDEDQKYVFITHLPISRSLIDNPENLDVFKYCMTRLYTLDRSISEEVRKFVQESKSYQVKYLRPILKRPIQGGSDIDEAITKQLNEYEKQLTLLVLNKLPRVIQLVNKNINDQDYLFYHLNTIVRQLINGLEDFRLQPIIKASLDAESMYLRLTSFSILLNKLHKTLCDSVKDEEQKTAIVTEPLRLLKEEIVNTEEGLEELKEYLVELEEYEKDKQKRGFFGRIFGKKEPEYTKQDVYDERQSRLESLFMFIIRLEKNHRNIMVYPEYEFYMNADNRYRHYSFADGKLGIERLPRLIRLPENRKEFEFQNLKVDISKSLL